MNLQQPQADTTLSLSRAPEQSLEDICRNGVDESRCLVGVFKIVHPSSNTIKDTLVGIRSAKGVESCRVFFKLDRPLLQRLDDIAPHDSFRLSLRGCTMEKLQQIPKLSTLPVQLIYSRGLHIEWNNRAMNRTDVMNTWPVKPSPHSTTDEWFLSQDNADSAQRVKRKRENGEGIDEETSKNEQSSKLSKRQRKRMREAASNASTKEQINDSGAAATRPKDPSPPLNEIPQPQRLTSEAARVQASPPPLPVHDAPAQKEDRVTIKDLVKGRCPLLIGVVKNIGDIKQTSTGDWMRVVQIVDASNCYTPGFKVNCFAKKHPECLPHAVPWDVLILRDLQVTEFQGNLVGTGYFGRLQWAAFSPKKGQVYHNERGTAPKEVTVNAANGETVSFNPFYQPTSADIQSCISLSDWWRSFIKENGMGKANETKAQPISYVPTSRIHRLLSDASPSAPPNGYFDCTVEVIHGQQSNQVYTVWVTDYTENPQAASVTYHWCPRVLSNKVIPFQLWDAASSYGPSMKPGDYYHIENARMKISLSGCLEGKVVQPKISQLSASRDAGRNKHLKALLERKQLVHEEESRVDPSMTYTLLQNVEENKFFNCTVEVLHVSRRPGRRPRLYVTDYTYLDKLSGSVNESWANDFDGRVLKVILSEEQESAAADVEEGGYYCMKNMRLKQSAVEECYCVILGGSDRLIIPLNANKTDNEHLNGLLRRRENWKHRSKDARMEIPPTIKAPAQLLNVKDIAIDSDKHRIMGRIVDFYPLELKDAFVQRCTRCQEEIPKQQRACTKCGDFDHEFIEYLFQLYIIVEDSNGEQLLISIDDKSAVFGGLKRGCLHEDNKIFTEFCQKVKTILGNLTLVHSGLKANKSIEVSSPLCCFDLSSWSLPGGNKAFALQRYRPVDVR